LVSGGPYAAQPLIVNGDAVACGPDGIACFDLIRD
jgi:hypothetical protein